MRRTSGDTFDDFIVGINWFLAMESNHGVANVAIILTPRDE